MFLVCFRLVHNVVILVPLVSTTLLPIYTLYLALVIATNLVRAADVTEMFGSV